MKQPVYKYLLYNFDLLFLNLSFYLALGIYNYINWGDFFIHVQNLWQPIVIFIFSLFVLFIFQYFNLYKYIIIYSRIDHFLGLIESIIISSFLYTFLAFFFRYGFEIESRITIILFFFNSLIILAIYRIIFFVPLFKWLARKKIYTERAAIIGGGETAKLLAANLEINSSYGISVVGFVDDNILVDTILFKSKKVIGKVDEIESLIKKFRIKELIICTENTNYSSLLQIVDKCSKTNVRLKVASPLYGIIKQKITSEKYGDIPIIEIDKSQIKTLNMFLKRIFDVIFATIGLIILLPFMIIISLFILIDSGWPIIFSQVRIGKDGKPFKFYKFRSMYVTKDEDKNRAIRMKEFIKGKGSFNSRQKKVVDESKITKIGKFLRKTSIDELPQLINVLIGDMSLVGPRPCLPYEYEIYDDWHKKRLSTIPGCTGIWQVSGRSEVEFSDMVIMDLYYIQNQSILLDLKIILKTIPVMIFGKGGI